MLSIPPPRASRADRDPDPYEFDPEFDPPQQLPLPLLLTKEALDAASLGELLQAYNLIGARLPTTELDEVGLEQDLVRQKLALQELQARVLSDNKASPQHKAQVANSLSNILSSLAKMREAVKKQTRQQLQEAALMDVLDALPEQAQRDFMQAYQASLVRTFARAGNPSTEEA